MPRASLTDLCEEKIAEAAGRSGQRFVDLRLDVCLYPSDRLLLSVGGVWDRLQREYADDKIARTRKAIRIHDGQLEAFEWFAEWLRAFLVREDPSPRDTEKVWSALFGGGRRGGKTVLGVDCLGVTAIACPGSLGWFVSQSIAKSWEVHDNVTKVLPKQWYTGRGAPWFEYTLLNDSMLWQKSAHDPDDLKQGGVSIVLLNEGQKLEHRAFVNCRGATADEGGIVIVAANPPETAKGQWVLDFHDEVVAGRRKAVYFHFDHELNPFIESQSLEDLEDEVDERTFRTQVRGEFLPRGDIVFYNWSRHDNEVELPDVGDFTAEFLRRHQRHELTDVLGVDFQLHPYNAGVSVRFVRDPADPEGDPLIWYDNFVLTDGTEREFSDALLDAGYDQERTLLVVDASGFWQNNERTKGRPSAELLKECGWRHIVRPDKRMERNPDVVERVKLTLSLIKSKAGRRRLFSRPALLELNRAIRMWEIKNGAPYRRSPHAHLCDAATYPLWRFFPRRRRAGSFRAKVIRRFSRRDKLKGL